MTSSAGGACGARAPSSRTPTTSSSSAAARTAWRPPTTCASAGSPTSAILEKSYIGSGAAGRNTTILRSNYKTPEGARFYDASVKLYEGLSQELNFNLLFSQCGHLTLAHSDRAMFVMANRAEVNRLQGIDSRLIGPDEVKRAGPGDVRRRRTATYPIMGALYHPPGGIIRHDAVVWGLARGADAGRRRDPPLHRGRSASSAPTGASTRCAPTAARSAPGRCVNCTAGWSTLLCDMAGVRLPITTHILQACVTEPVKPLLDVVIVSSQMHVYVSQTDRGEFLMGAEIEPWTTYRMQGTLNFLQEVTRHTLELFPQLEHARLLRSWAGPVRPQPRLQPDPRQDRGRQLPRQRRLGHLRLQGRADRRQDARRARRHRPHAGPDRALRARALLRGPPRVRARRRRRQPLNDHGATVKSSLEIAQEAVLKPIEQIAERGRARRTRSSSPTAATRRRSTSASSTACTTAPDGKLVCVTGMTPTQAPARARRRRWSASRRGSASSASARSPACASPRSARCSASRAAPPAAA